MSFFGRAFTRFGYNKNIDTLLEESAAKGGLKKTLTARDLVTLGVAGIIGAGIFVLVGEGAATAGVGVAGAFVAAAAICAVAGLAYAELASTIPASGSAYAYLYTAMGELPGWLVAWALILEYAVGAIAVAVGWRSNFLALVNQFFGSGDEGLFDRGLAYGLTHSPFESATLSDGTAVQGIINLPSIAIVMGCAGLLYFGTKESARVTAILVAIKVAILMMAIGVGFYLLDPANLGLGADALDPLPASADSFAGATSAVLAAGAIMFFAYIGFDSVSTTAEETKNPKKDLPIGILGSLAITTVLYILAALALVGSAHWSLFAGDGIEADQAKEEPFGYVFEQAADDTTGGERTFLLFSAALVRVGALIGITSVLLVLILGGVRVFFNMSRDGLLPGAISRVHPTRGNPAFTTLLYGGFTLMFAGFLTLGRAVALVNIGTLFAFLMVVLAVWAFRVRRPDIERAFTMPMWSILNTKSGKPILPMLPILGSIAIVVLIFKLNAFTLFSFLAWTGVGLVVYAFYGLRNSKEAAARHLN